ncbi:MAG: L-threonylcarbamoyladenylate synthase [Alphaproteobacteria bacterium]
MRRTAALIRAGRLVAFPTETVYGLGADATNDRAVAAIFAAKDRPRINPVIVHVLDAAEAARHARLDGASLALAERFWPGPLTLVLPRREPCALSLLVSAGLATVGLRAPAHPVARALIAEAGVPVAAPSANPSGRLSPTRAVHVAEALGDRVDLVLDGGPTPLGLESTVIDAIAQPPVLLRPGALDRAAIEAMIGPLAAPPEDESPRSPGLLARHYAPRTPLRLDAREARSGEAMLAFGPVPAPNAAIVRNLSPTGDLIEAAANLFAMLHELDQSGASAIAVAPIPETGLGEAINDRLRRAARG